MGKRLSGILGFIVVAAWLIVPVQGQRPSSAANRVARADWPSHNLDVKNTRFSPLDQINASNVDKLALKWSFQPGPSEPIAQKSPLVIDGVMYFNAGYKLFAVNAATGKIVWTVQAPRPRESPAPNPKATGGTGGRGPAYGDGRIYALADSVMYAVDAKTGKFVESFGDKGRARFVNDALEFKWPGRYPKDADSVNLGYRMSAPPAYYNGTLYVGLASSANLIPGGLVVALDGTTAAIKWVFTVIPQGPGDDGWEIAKSTWSGTQRAGGGIWTQPAIDPDMGMIYVNAANAGPDFDGTGRTGSNLFSDSIVALHLATGKLAWYYQTVHHDIWDKDLTNGPVLFDAVAEGRSIKGIASFGKTCYAYILDRQTGQPINPIVETPVPTKTDIPGAKPWPTQPVPYTSTGLPQQPFCSVYPIVKDAELAKRVRPPFHPFQANELVIVAPGMGGGANWGSSSFSPRLGLLYVTGINGAVSVRVKVVGDTLKPGPENPGFFGSTAENAETGVRPTQTLAAYEPVTGRQVWSTEISEGSTNAGVLTTAGDVIFHSVAIGRFFASDAKSGRRLFTHTDRSISSSPITYEVQGKQYVSVMAGDKVLAFALP